MPLPTRRFEPRVSRRHLFGMSAAGVGAAVLGSTGRAQAEADAPAPAVDNNVGHYHTAVGKLRVTLLNDGHFFFDPMHPTLGGNVAPENFAAAVEAARMPADGVSDIHAALVRHGNRVVLIDAGSGDTFAPTTGKLMSRLAASGVQPADVTDVVVTHAHLDHVGGLMLPDSGGPAFPNAAVHVAQAEHDFWRSDPKMAKSDLPDAMKQMVIRIANAAFDAVGDRLQLFDGGGERELLPGITAVPAPGHTPGHTAFLIHDGDEQLLFVGDAIFFVPVLTSNPDWYVAFDTDPQAGAAARFKLMDRIAADRLRISGSHLPFPAFAQLTRSGAGFKYHPEPWRF